MRRLAFALQAGPELEIPGYGCEDHFAENDTLEHCWECLAELIRGGHSSGIVCDLGMPVMLGSVRYNCRVYLLDGRLLLIRPKISLADDGNYRCKREPQEVCVMLLRLCMRVHAGMGCCCITACSQVPMHSEPGQTFPCTLGSIPVPTVLDPGVLLPH